MPPYDDYPMMLDPYLTPEMMAPMIFVLALLVLLELMLKGVALWRAARMTMPGWFIALMILNTAGIFPLLFIVFTNTRYEAHNVLPTKKPSMKKKTVRTS